MNENEARALTDLMNVLIPGDEDFPRGGAANFLSSIVAHPRFGPTATRITALLPSGFSTSPIRERVATAAAIEREHRVDFDAFLVALYCIYYGDPGVLAAIERTSGYRAGPPQPRGYELPSFNPASVIVPASRAESYRKIE